MTITEVEVFKALADDTRLRILHLFLASKDALCVCEIVDALKMPQYGVSKHLTVLRHAGIVDVKKKGLWGYYKLQTDEPGNRILLAFLKHYLTGEVYQQDKRNLARRLLLREKGQCVIGFVAPRGRDKRSKHRKLATTSLES